MAKSSYFYQLPEQEYRGHRIAAQWARDGMSSLPADDFDPGRDYPRWDFFLDGVCFKSSYPVTEDESKESVLLALKQAVDFAIATAPPSDSGILQDA